MSFYIAQTMRRLFAPQHRLSCSFLLWRRLLEELRLRGLNGKRESGAFLLGYREANAIRIETFVPYDDIDPGSLTTGIVRLDGRFFGRLWDICEVKNLSVVADIHTHPTDSAQSSSDRDNPIISRAGHIALILPNFAIGSISPPEIGMYAYLGKKTWQTIPSEKRQSFFYIGF